MQIKWHPNPLYTTIHLDEFEKKELWYKIKINELEDDISLAKYYLSKKPEPNIIKALDFLNYDVNRPQEMYEYYIKALEDGNHCGDCTCVPTSCDKCFVEDLLGINTIKGLGKHSAYKIDGAFGESNVNSIDYVLDYLKNYSTRIYDNAPTWKGWEKHLPRWTKEANDAYDWLLNYKNEHNF